MSVTDDLAQAIKRMATPRASKAVYVGVITDTTGGFSNPSVTVREITQSYGLQCRFTDDFRTILMAQGDALVGRQVLVSLYDGQPFVTNLLPVGG